MILDGKKKAVPLHTARARSTEDLKISPAMQAVIDRCRTPRQITPSNSTVHELRERARLGELQHLPERKGR